MDNIFEQFPTREAFDEYWKENYAPLSYADVRQEYEDFVKSADKHIFLSDYEEGGSISRDTFMENLSQDAAFTFQDTLTEVFYDKNPELYENAFAIYEETQMNGAPNPDIAQIFHEEYNRLYREFLFAMYDALFA
jgi:hypothetical protein